MNWIRRHHLEILLAANTVSAFHDAFSRSLILLAFNSAVAGWLLVYVIAKYRTDKTATKENRP